MWPIIGYTISHRNGLILFRPSQMQQSDLCKCSVKCLKIDKYGCRTEPFNSHNDLVVHITY